MRVWVGHWFSTAYHFINSLKEAGAYVIASNYRDTCVYKTNADEFYIEPEILDDKEYIDYCLDFCKEHNVELILPRKHIKAMSLNKDKFAEIGVKLACEDSINVYELFESKLKTASYFKDFDGFLVPEQIGIKTLKEFKDAYKELQERYGLVCIKQDIDEGGQSYKLISERAPKLERLRENNGLVYSYDYICSCLNCVDSFSTQVLMPYLNGVEISVDCFGVDSEHFYAVPRQKLSNRVTRLEPNSKLFSICKEFWERTGLKCPFNIQFRYHNDALYLLEVNLRLSGGSWKAKEVGVDFIKLLYNYYLGLDLPKINCNNFTRCDLSNIEGCIKL